MKLKKYKNANILMIMSELADGSLFDFYKKELNNDYKNKKIILNAFGQIYISLIFYHKIMNAFHGDSHSGNFLFRRIKKGGYYHYNIFGKDYYIENLGYVWEIWDFGIALGFSDSEEVNKNRLEIIKEPLFSFEHKIPKNVGYYFCNSFKYTNIYIDYTLKIANEKLMISMFPENDDTKYLYDFFNAFKTTDFIRKFAGKTPLDMPELEKYVLELMLKHNFIQDKISSNKKPYSISI
jgi:hypothetical protein